MLRSREGILVVVAHPDDEVVGASAQLLRAPRCRLVHVTDGAPRDMRDARAAGFTTREAYARARRDELHAAVAYAGLHPCDCDQLGAVDQEASFELDRLARAVAAVLLEHCAAVVITHPFEGGHPDHDATAFAVHAAARMLDAAGTSPPSIVEMTSYHAGAEGIRTGAFLPGGPPHATVRLGRSERQAKRAMLACFRSQLHMLRLFPVSLERLRVAPAYDFTTPPHAGRLLYEQFDWGMDGATWSRLAVEASRSLFPEPRPWR